uniref:FBD domain-containing protein n=1 Tax=Syphacia muris TaxID=451379 RepID=A0A0N5AX41_9BILA
MLEFALGALDHWAIRKLTGAAVDVDNVDGGEFKDIFNLCTYYVTNILFFGKSSADECKDMFDGGDERLILWHRSGLKVLKFAYLSR